jgi:hypothetical protein
LKFRRRSAGTIGVASIRNPPRTLQIGRRLRARIEQKIERRHRVFEAAMQLRILLVAFMAHPLRRDAGRFEITHYLSRYSLNEMPL